MKITWHFHLDDDNKYILNSDVIWDHLNKIFGQKKRYCLLSPYLRNLTLNMLTISFWFNRTNTLLVIQFKIKSQKIKAYAEQIYKMNTL